ncbi:MAG: hypothetical protein LBC44_02000 [Mycoplasmataceae bacterium]|nr:hypothetical protein [Mycoplasmataceae bacterium]
MVFPKSSVIFEFFSVIVGIAGIILLVFFVVPELFLKKNLDWWEIIIDVVCGAIFPFVVYKSIRELIKIKKQINIPTDDNIHDLVEKIKFTEDNKEILKTLMQDRTELWEIYNFKYFKKLILGKTYT